MIRIKRFIEIHYLRKYLFTIILIVWIFRRIPFLHSVSFSFSLGSTSFFSIFCFWIKYFNAFFGDSYEGINHCKQLIYSPYEKHQIKHFTVYIYTILSLKYSINYEKSEQKRVNNHYCLSVRDSSYVKVTIIAPVTPITWMY